MSSAAAAATAPAPPTMKLLVDTGAQRCVFAEAGKDIVDFLFGLLAMPLGAADRLLAVAGDGSIANVYASVQRMDDAFVQSAAARDELLLDPAAPPPPPRPSSAAADSSFSEPALSFLFASGILPISKVRPDGSFGIPVRPCPAATAGGENQGHLRPDPNHALPLYLYRCNACRAEGLPKGSGGFKDLTTYTVTDDLIVAPASSASSAVALLKSLGVRDLDALEERTVNVGREEALGILRAALHSKTVLTDAFLAEKRKRARVSGRGDKDDTGSTSE